MSEDPNKQAINNLARKGQDFATGAATHISIADNELWGLVTDVPKLEKLIAIVCALLNVFFAGSGTMLSGCIVKNAGWNKT